LRFVRKAQLAVRNRSEGTGFVKYAKFLLNADVDTFNFDCINLDELAESIGEFFSLDSAIVKKYFFELLENLELRKKINSKSKKKVFCANLNPGLGRYLPIYAILRILKPREVIELGTKHGLGSFCYQQALILNGNSKLYSIDINPRSGWMNRSAFIHSDSLNFLDNLPVTSSNRFIISDGVTDPKKINQEFSTAREKTTGDLFFLHNIFGFTVQNESARIGKRALKIIIRSNHLVEKKLIFWFADFGIKD
jgi:hypothetical protein